MATAGGGPGRTGSSSAPSRLELLVHALSGEATSTGKRNVSNQPWCLHGAASATGPAGSMLSPVGCVLERSESSSSPAST